MLSDLFVQMNSRNLLLNIHLSNYVPIVRLFSSVDGWILLFTYDALLGKRDSSLPDAILISVGSHKNCVFYL